MFVIQVDFKDGVNQVESAYINRLFVKIGTTESSHLILDGVRALPYQLGIIRGLGDTFTCKALWIEQGKKQELSWEKEYSHSAHISLPDVHVYITSIPGFIAQKVRSDDLSYRLLTEMLRTNENTKSIFPAFISSQSPRVSLSVGGVDELRIGNTRSCLLRIDSFREKKEYAKVSQSAAGFELENIHSRDVIKVNNNVISSKVLLGPRDRIHFSCGVEVIYVTSEEDLRALSDELPDFLTSLKGGLRRNMRAIGGPISPTVVPLHVGQTVSIGRDPGHNMWIDAPFISRLHCSIYVEEDGYVCSDFSTNGVEVNGKKLTKGMQERFPNAVMHISFGHGTGVLISDFDENAAREYLRELNSKDQKKVEAEDENHFVVEGDLPGESSEKVSSSEYEEADSISQLDQEEVDFEKNEAMDTQFEEYQKRSLRILEESGAQFLAVDVPEEEREEFPIRIGYTKYLPQIFITGLILVIVVFLIILATNLVR